jgi:tetratricopeptide (TPR) repeat protein
VVDIAQVLLGDEVAAASWRLAYRMVSGQSCAAGIVQVSTALPNDLPGFTGRQGELQRLIDGLTPQRPDTAAAMVVEGMAGVGKTTLVIHAGHQLLHRGHGTDLQLSVNLRGYDPELPPADPAAVLDGFLRVLGVPGDQIYHLDLAGRAARYRRLLAGRRALIVLDNAATQEQVTPLLPHTPGCLTMITSRHALVDLPGMRRLPLGVLTETDALDLLRRTIGSDRVDTAPQAAADIARLLGCLPLALGVVAGRINNTPQWTLSDHLARLAERHQLRQLDSGIELAVDLSYQALAPNLQRMLRLLALHCGPDFDTYAAAALGGTDLPTANRRMDSLVAANLLQRPSQNRYHLHDLIQVYAAARAIDDEPDSARRTALTRLFDSYLYTSAKAMDALRPPVGRRRRPTIPEPRTPGPPIADRAAARAWFTAEHANVLAAVAHTATHGWPTHTTKFSAILNWWLSISGHYDDGLTVHRHALDAARISGDRDAEGLALMNLGAFRERLGQYHEAFAALQQALRISRQVGDRYMEGRSRGRLGATEAALGHYPNAIEHFSSAAAIYHEIGDRAAEGAARNNIGDTYDRMGYHNQAIVHHQQALAISRAVDDRVLMCTVLADLSGLYARLGRHSEASEYHGQALALSREHGIRPTEAYLLSISGLIHEADHPATRDHHRRALAIAGEIGDPNMQASIMNNIGETLRGIGRPDDALRYHHGALNLTREAGIPYEQARAHDGIAHAMHATGQLDQARAH